MSSISLLPIQDASVFELEPDSNFGSDNILYCGKLQVANSIYRSLLQFDISYIPNVAHIQSAILKLYIVQNNVPSLSKATSVYNLLESFTQNNVTYNTQPAFDSTASASLDITSESNVYLNFDVTNLVRNWHIGNFPNYGLVIRGEESFYSLTGFYSSDYSEPDKRPILEITYNEDIGIIEYLPETATSYGDAVYSIPIVLGGNIGTFCIKNLGPKSCYLIKQLSADKVVWIDDHLSYLTLYHLDPDETITLTTSGYMLYTCLKLQADDCVDPSDHASLLIYKTVKY